MGRHRTAQERAWGHGCVEGQSARGRSDGRSSPSRGRPVRLGPGTSPHAHLDRVCEAKAAKVCDPHAGQTSWRRSSIQKAVLESAACTAARPGAGGAPAACKAILQTFLRTCCSACVSHASSAGRSTAKSWRAAPTCLAAAVRPAGVQLVTLPLSRLDASISFVPAPTSGRGTLSRWLIRSLWAVVPALDVTPLPAGVEPTEDDIPV